MLLIRADDIINGGANSLKRIFNFFIFEIYKGSNKKSAIKTFVGRCNYNLFSELKSKKWENDRIITVLYFLIIMSPENDLNFKKEL